ncbi:hypothetical protein P4603_25035 [Priestia aryabhattai]|uniref:hypothetical protein n=1 Tax=Priestia aryabhattai TaxID=412384 RepID=UPI0012D4B770|nr:hypothetical protein [Priestia aryabhattai]MED3955365.1 hypothetical protein [Priestia aryabhattai]
MDTLACDTTVDFRARLRFPRAAVGVFTLPSTARRNETDETGVHHNKKTNQESKF